MDEFDFFCPEDIEAELIIGTERDNSFANSDEFFEEIDDFEQEAA